MWPFFQCLTLVGRGSFEAVNQWSTQLRKGLAEFFPSIQSMHLVDYAVRILDEGEEGTGAQVRVLIESTDGVATWRTVGCSTNLIEASWQALADSVEYFLLRQQAAVVS